MKKNNSTYVWGLILILLGAFLLGRELFPQLRLVFDWPWIIIGVGLVFLLFALFTKTGGLAVPGAIISGIGSILLFQNLTNMWETWSFAWALIPGFVGIGIGLATLISPNENQGEWTSSLFLMGISAVLFILFGGFRFFGMDLDFLWPVIIVIFGVFLLVKGFIRK